MAECKTCGDVNPKFPVEWVNWECIECERDLWRTQADPAGAASVQSEGEWWGYEAGDKHPAKYAYVVGQGE
jgi:hypothetical protein